MSYVTSHIQGMYTRFCGMLYIGRRWILSDMNLIGIDEKMQVDENRIKHRVYVRKRTEYTNYIRLPSETLRQSILTVMVFFFIRVYMYYHIGVCEFKKYYVLYYRQYYYIQPRLPTFITSHVIILELESFYYTCLMGNGGKTRR